MSAILPHMAWP